MNTRKANSLKFKKELASLAKLMAYSYHWYADVQEESDGYKIGGAETLAHMIACFFAQELGVEDLETAYTRDFFKLDLYGESWDKEHFFKELLKFKKLLLTEHE